MTAGRRWTADARKSKNNMSIPQRVAVIIPESSECCFSSSSESSDSPKNTEMFEKPNNLGKISVVG